MEYKICENCHEKLHVRTKKCPFCNTILTDKSEIITEEVEAVKSNLDADNETIKIMDSSSKENNENAEFENEPKFEAEVGGNFLPDKELKDYVYKAEVRHSLEYTKLMPNSLKVFVTAISMVPVIGQVIGTFFGVFFLTYEDSDRKSFGRSLICLSIIMFLIYTYNLVVFSQLLETEGLSSLMNSIQ